MWGFYLWKLKELRCKNGRSGRLERWWCIGIRKSSKIDSTSKSFTSSPTIFRELLKTSALCSSVNGGHHICHNRASILLFTVIPSGYLAKVMINKNDMLIFTPCNTLSHGHYQNNGTQSEIELGLPWRHLAWALILIMPMTSGIALHLSSGVVKLG